MNSKEPSGELVAREQGATTLQECGWCEYASGSHRYNYCISGHCSLQKSYSKEVHWDDKCEFLTASKNEINRIIDSHEYEIKNHESSIKAHGKYIKTLRGLSKEAPIRPPLPKDRKYDHFNLGNDIAVFFHDCNKWYFGKVVLGYRHHDGCVSYVLQGYGPQEKEFWGCGTATPIIFLKREYDFFKDHTGDYSIWCEKAYKESFNGEKLSVAKIDTGLTPKGGTQKAPENSHFEGTKNDSST